MTPYREAPSPAVLVVRAQTAAFAATQLVSALFCGFLAAVFIAGSGGKLVFGVLDNEGFACRAIGVPFAAMAIVVGATDRAIALSETGGYADETTARRIAEFLGAAYRPPR